MKIAFNPYTGLVQIFKNYFSVIVFLLLYTSCSPGWYVRKYKLIKKEGINIDTLKVRTDGIYLNKDFVYDTDKTVKSRYNYIRFFNNGREYYSHEYHDFPTDENFNDLQNGGYSYYTIKDSLIISESYNYEAGCFFHITKSFKTEI